MNEILGYFFHPEISMDELLCNESKGKWREGILKWVLVAILSGLLTVVIYKVAGVQLENLAGSYYGDIIYNLSERKVNEGFIWLILVALSVGETLMIATIRSGLWIILLYIISKVLREQVERYQIVKMSVFAILTWIVAGVFSSIAVLISMFSSVSTLNEMIMGLGMLLDYWYLILFIIGYSMITRSTFLKGSIVVLIIQAIFWGMANAFPVLQIILV